MVAPDSLVRDSVAVIADYASFTELPADVEKLLSVDLQPPPQLIISTPSSSGAAPREIAQLLSSQYLGTSVYLIADQSLHLDRKLLLKNGFKDVFLMPMDRGVLEQNLREFVANSTKEGKVFRSVKLIDVSPETKLEFDTYIYLPANNKHIKFTSSGTSLSRERAERLKSHQVGSLFVPAPEMKKFYEYTSNRLKEIRSSSDLSETERAERLKSSVRDLFGSIFSEAVDSTESGKGLVSEGQKIVKSYLTTDGGQNWFSRFQAISADTVDSYSHASNTAAYATLFAIGLNLPNVEEIAMAALLHDLGMARVPKEILDKPRNQWTPAETEKFQKHIDYTMDIIREKKLILSDLVRKAIMQHHEKFNGTGYPKGLAGTRIAVEAQLLVIADLFDELTTIQPGRPRMTPNQAIAKFHEEMTGDPGKMMFDHEKKKKILALFPDEVKV